MNDTTTPVVEEKMGLPTVSDERFSELEAKLKEQEVVDRKQKEEIASLRRQVAEGAKGSKSCTLF